MSTEDNKSVIRRQEAALNTGLVDAGLDLFTDPFVYNGQQASREVIPQVRTTLWSAVPDVRWTLEHMIAEGEWVAVRWTMRGRHTGDFAHPTLGSAPASGNPVAVTYVGHYRIVGGQITEVWEVRDGVALLQQLGALSKAGAAPAQ